MFLMFSMYVFMYVFDVFLMFKIPLFIIIVYQF